MSAQFLIVLILGTGFLALSLKCVFNAITSTPISFNNMGVILPEGPYEQSTTILRSAFLILFLSTNCCNDLM